MEAKKGLIQPTAPQWLVEAAQQYAGPIDANTETHFLRAVESTTVLDMVLPSLSKTPHIMIAGLGLAREPLIHSYVPFIVSAHLEGKGIDYRMTLVDIDPEVIADIRMRRNIFVLKRAYRTTTGQAKVEANWAKYLKDTNQQGSIVTELVSGLTFAPYMMDCSHHPPYYIDYLSNGIFVAEVSPIFRNKLQSEEVRLLEGDITTVDLHSRRSFDYVECVNTLYQLSTPGQQLAIANMAASIKSGGFLLIDDYGPRSLKFLHYDPIFPEFGGWLTDARLTELGLIKESETENKQSSNPVLLRKK